MRTYSISGRDAVGIVREVNVAFVAIMTDGTVIGEFATLREAAAALPDGGAS